MSRQVYLDEKTKKFLGLKGESLPEVLDSYEKICMFRESFREAVYADLCSLLQATRASWTKASTIVLP